MKRIKNFSFVALFALVLMVSGLFVQEANAQWCTSPNQTINGRLVYASDTSVGRPYTSVAYRRDGVTAAIAVTDENGYFTASNLGRCTTYILFGMENGGLVATYGYNDGHDGFWNTGEKMAIGYQILIGF